MEEPNVPAWVTERLECVIKVLTSYFPVASLSMGGTTVLQARWNHRTSTDIELFADSSVFHAIVGTSARKLENKLHKIDVIDSDQSWVELNLIYCEVDGVELKVTPSIATLNETSGYELASTKVKTETTASILYRKIAGRMIESGTFEVPDVFDLYTAMNVDQRAFTKAVQAIPGRSLQSVSAMLKVLPPRWFLNTTKPLLGVPNPPSQEALIEAITREFDAISAA